MSVSDSRTMNALYSLTADHYYKSGVIHDGIFKGNQSWAELTKKGVKKNVDGGTRIQVSLMYGQNETVNSISPYGLIDTSPQDGIEPAIYPWSQYAGTVAISGMEQAQNKGKAQIQNLMREKTKQLIMSFQDRMNKDLWDVTGLTHAAASVTTGNGGLNILGIPAYVQKTPGTVTATLAGTGGGVGGITCTGGAAPWWKNKTSDNAAADSTFAALQFALQNMYTETSKGNGGPPNLVITSPELYGFYERSLQSQVRYTSSDTATVGFESMAYKGAKMFWDEMVPDMDTPLNADASGYSPTTLSSAFFLNTNFLEVMTLDGNDFAPLGFERPVNQNASVGSWIFMGQLTCSNRRKQGTVFHLTTTAVA
jgi:hypothetical protein